MPGQPKNVMEMLERRVTELEQHHQWSPEEIALQKAMMRAWMGWGFAFGSFRKVLIFIGILATAVLAVRAGFSEVWEWLRTTFGR